MALDFQLILELVYWQVDDPRVYLALRNGIDVQLQRQLMPKRRISSWHSLRLLQRVWRGWRALLHRRARVNSWRRRRHHEDDPVGMFLVLS